MPIIKDRLYYIIL